MSLSSSYQFPLFVTEKRCSKCNAVKSPSEFYTKDKRTGRLFSWCKECHSRITNAKYVPVSPKPPEPPRTEKLCPKCKAVKPIDAFARKPGTTSQVRSWCRACHRDEGRQYKAERAVQIKAKNAAYRATRAAELAARQRQWRIDHPDAYHAIHSKWKSENKDIVNASTHKRRARKHAIPGYYTGADLKAMYETQDGRCAYCATPLNGRYHIEHKIPLARDGATNWPDNICLSCPTCNLRKGTLTDAEFRQKLANEAINCSP